MNGYGSTDTFVFTGTLDRAVLVRPKVLFTTIKIDSSDYQYDLNGKYVEAVAFEKNAPVYYQVQEYSYGDSIRARGRIERKMYNGEEKVQLVITSLNPVVQGSSDHRDYATVQDVGLDVPNDQNNLHDEDSELFPEQFVNDHEQDEPVTNTDENVHNDPVLEVLDQNGFIDDFFVSHIKENKEYLQNGNKDAKPDLEYTDRLEGEKDSISKMFDGETI